MPCGKIDTEGGATWNCYHCSATGNIPSDRTRGSQGFSCRPQSRLRPRSHCSCREQKVVAEQLGDAKQAKHWRELKVRGAELIYDRMAAPQSVTGLMIQLVLAEHAGKLAAIECRG